MATNFPNGVAAYAYIAALEQKDLLDFTMLCIDAMRPETLEALAELMEPPAPQPLAAGRNAAFVMSDGKLTLRVTKPRPEALNLLSELVTEKTKKRPDPIEKPLTDLKRS